MNAAFLLVLGVASVTFVACSPGSSDTAVVAPPAAGIQEADESVGAASGGALDPMGFPDSPQEKVIDNQQLADSEVRVIEVEAGSFYYRPEEIRVKKGETVKIVVNSVDMMHDFVIDELNVKVPVTRSGETNTVEFTVDTVGEFEYYCSVGAHREQGQIGTLIVEE